MNMFKDLKDDMNKSLSELYENTKEQLNETMKLRK